MSLILSFPPPMARRCLGVFVRFARRSGSGAAVDWAVVSAAVLAIALAVVMGVGQGTLDLGRKVGDHLDPGAAGGGATGAAAGRGRCDAPTALNALDCLDP